jgi:hypothetical protein
MDINHIGAQVNAAVTAGKFTACTARGVPPRGDGLRLELPAAQYEIPVQNKQEFREIRIARQRTRASTCLVFRQTTIGYIMAERL